MEQKDQTKISLSIQMAIKHDSFETHERAMFLKSLDRGKMAET